MLFDFSGGVQEFVAMNGYGKKLSVRKIDKDTWRIENGIEKNIVVEYKVYANEFNQRTRELNSDHGFIDPASVFMYVDELKNRPLQLTIHPFNNWHVTTGLEEIKEKPNTYTAPNFEYFIDCPIEIGNQHDTEFYVDGKRHIISLFGEGNWNTDTLIQDFSKIIAVNKDFWGKLPYKKYIFMIQCQPNASGGTEHINSTVMGVRPFIFSNPNSYKGFLGLVSHEYFHTWNVKQLRPKAFAPYDLSKEGYTEELWISEGTTSYFDELLLVYSGHSTAKSFIDQIPGMVYSDRSRFGNTIQPLSESSFDAWVKFWRGKQNALIAQSDYYGKGAHLSLLLDLEIRQRSHNKFSLQSVMKKMFELFPPAKGFTNSDFQRMCEEAADSNLKDFFSNYLYGITPLPWENILRYAGLELTVKDSIQKMDLGLSIDATGEKIRISNIIPGSPADNAHVEINDEIIALNGFKVKAPEFTERTSQLKEKEQITVTIFRNDKLKEIVLTAEKFGISTYTITKTVHATELQKAIYESWLKEPF